tara:strand:+ start:1259 stop:1540 length:282 start_codon:yes stop_codon:yes gene_type:complete
MDFYKYLPEGETGQLKFNSSIFLNLLTEDEMCAFFRNETQIISDTALLMSKRDSVVNVESARFDSVMAACVTAEIFNSARVAEFKRGITWALP